jgi:hypothetical protein
MVTLPSVPGSPQREVTRPPREWALEFESAPVPVAMAMLAERLRELAEKKIPNLRDLTCDVVISPGGTCSLYFRAYR